MKVLSTIFSLFICCTSLTSQGFSYLDLSQNMIIKIQQGQTIKAELDTLKVATIEDFQQELDTDLKKITFWVNVYNAYIQVILREKPMLYENRFPFFGKERFIIAGTSLSFGDMEHGIIRGGQSLVGFGFLPMIFQSSFIRKLKVKKTDYRVHFALNCGAVSCPPVVALDHKIIDQQLDILTAAYIKKHSRYEATQSVVYVPKLLQWFAGDWGNKKARRLFLKKYGIIPEDSKPKFDYVDYDWTLKLDNFSS